MDINDNNFQKEVLEASGVVLADFWAPWCKPCMMLVPVLESLTEENKDKLKICKINIDESQKAAESLGVMSIPTLKFFKEGKEVGELVGLQSKDVIQAEINKHVG